MWNLTIMQRPPRALFLTGRRRSLLRCRICIISLSPARASSIPILDTASWEQRCLVPPGESYLTYVPKHIFQPLGMTHSALEWNAQMEHLAKGYQVMGPNGAVDSETPLRENVNGHGYKIPNGAIYTTVGDLARFGSFLMGEGPESVLKSTSLNLFQKQLIVPADIGLTSGYGIGFQVERRDNYVAFGHGGAVAGYTSELLMNRQKEIGVIVFSNGAANPADIAQNALDLLSK
jgi:CubicO group peptidase (beta-lactamase class C family)